MRYLFDLTGTALRKLQFFPDAVAAFTIPAGLEQSLSLLVWGVVYPQPEHEDLIQYLAPAVQRAMPAALYLSGWGELTFHEVHSGSVAVWPYAPTLDLTRLEFASANAEALSLKRTWEGSTPDGGVDYLLSTILEQPLGFMTLKVLATGRVTLLVDPHDFVTEEQLEQFPERYRLDLARTRQLARHPSPEQAMVTA